MGSGASKTSDMSLWSKEEQEANDKALKLQQKGVENCIKYFFYGLPVKATKQSYDPLSPVWVQPDTLEMEQRFAEAKASAKFSSANQSELFLALAPTVVMVGSDGTIKVVFECIDKSVELGLHREIPLDYTISNDDFFRPGSPFPPSPPRLIGASSYALTLEWTLPELTGISQLCDIQQCRVDASKELLTSSELRWLACTSKRWEYENFTKFTLENLQPGLSLIFRLRYRNCDTWSSWSPASDVFSTLPAVPSRPATPTISKIFPDSVLVLWSTPKDNGSSIRRFILQGKGAGDDVFFELYVGLSTAHYVTDLIPEFAYTFIVSAENDIGLSLASEFVSCKLPRRPAVRDNKIEPEVSHAAMAELCAEAWGEYFDHKTGKVFYFNKISGMRTQERPAAVTLTKTDESANEMRRKSEIEFRKKRFHLLLKLHSKKSGEDRGILSVEVNRHRLFWDAMDKLHALPVSSLRQRLRIVFKGEAGIDSGGLSKEFFVNTSKEIDHWLTDLNMICRATDEGIYFQAGDSDSQNKKADVLKFIGRFLGKAVFDRQLVQLNLSSLLLRRMKQGYSIHDQGYVLFDNSPNNLLLLEFELSRQLEELKQIDSAMHNSLQWILINSIENVIYENFSVVATSSSSSSSQKIIGGNYFSKGSMIDLCLNGSKIEVTEANKQEYVLLLAQWRTTFSVIDDLEPFLEGFSELVPPDALSEITESELNLMLNGRADIDIEEIRAYTMYQGGPDFQETHYSVVWLWDSLREFSLEDKRNFLKFVTGSSRTPLDGYDPPFNLTEGVDMKVDSLPKAHTCFNQLVLPGYSSKEIMVEKLLFSFANTEGFDLA